MKKIVLSLLLMFNMVSCVSGIVSKEVLSNADYEYKTDFNFEVNPKNFDLKITFNGVTESVSGPLEKREVSNFKNDGKKASWTYEKEAIDVNIQKEKEYLEVSIKSNRRD